MKTFLAIAVLLFVYLAFWMGWYKSSVNVATDYKNAAESRYELLMKGLK